MMHIFHIRDRSCTPAAAAVLDRYQKDGAQIARDIAVRYGH